MNKTKRIHGVGLLLGCVGLTCLGAVACGDEKDGSLLDNGSGANGTGASTGKGGGLNLGDGGDGSVDLGGDSAVGGGEGMSCVPIVIAAEPPVVNVLLVVDKSGSMEDQPTGFDTDKWTALTNALGAAFDATKADISYGLDLYPYSGKSGEVVADNQCSMPTAADVVVEVQAGTDAAPLILDALADNPPWGGTPTAAGLARALVYYTKGAGKDLPGEKYVLLATDGGPNCNGDLTCEAATCTVNIDGECPKGINCCDAELDKLGPQSCLDEDASVAAVKALANEGIRTFVVGIPGTEKYESTLDALAAESGVSNPDAPPEYFAVSAAGGVEGLSSVLEKITAGLITTCRLQLDHDAPLGEETYVWIEDAMLGKDDPDGWHLDESTSPDTVVLDGASCAKAETDGLVGVRITFGCPDKPH